jgi:predicted enzyme related to lactoylglutathione lyase
MADATVRGEFVWHDLLTPNAAGAHDFYGKAVGWKKVPWDEDPSYVMFSAPSGLIGGVVETRATTPQWLPYIGTPDVAATVETATGLGARVQTPPTPLPNGAGYAVLIDPQGAAFGIHASPDAGEDGAAPEAGEFSWHELATSVAPNVAFAFYAELFGWDEITQYDMGPMGPYLIFGHAGRQLGGMFAKGNAGKPGSAYWLGYVNVADLEATVELAKGARATLLTGPMDVPGGDRIATLMDPHGAFFALHVRTGSHATPAKPARKSAKPAAAKAKQPTRKPTEKRRPAKKAAAKKKPAARKVAKPKPKAKKPSPRKAPKKTKPKAKPRKR